MSAPMNAPINAQIGSGQDPHGAARPTPLLEARDLVQRFPLRGTGGFLRRPRLQAAVDGVSLALYPGEVVAVVGESGSGKTTLGRMMLGLLTPTEGRVLYQGQDIAGLHGEAWRRFRRDVQVVFQDTGGSLNPRQEEARDPSDYSNQPDRARGARNNYEQPQPHPPRRRYHEDEEDEEDEEAREYSRLPRRRDQPPAAHAQQERWQRERERERERQREVMEAEEREILERQRRLKAEIEMLQKISSNTAGPIGRLVKQEPPFALSPSKEDEDRGRRGRPRLGALSSHLQQQQQQPLVLVQSAQERRSMEQTRSTRPW